MRNINIIWIVIPFLFSCNTEKKSYSGINFPDYIDTIKNIEVDYDVDEMVVCYNHIQHLDTFDFPSQTIDLNRQPKYGEFRNYSFDGYSWPKDSIKIQILIDTTRVVPTKDNRINIIPPPPPTVIIESELISVRLDSSNTIENSVENLNFGNDQSNWINNYPVFIVNLTDTIVSLTYGAISGFPMIQEAKDSLGTWKPIQYWHWDWCGNTYSSWKRIIRSVFKLIQLRFYPMFGMPDNSIERETIFHKRKMKRR